MDELHRIYRDHPLTRHRDVKDGITVTPDDGSGKDPAWQEAREETRIVSRTSEHGRGVFW